MATPPSSTPANSPLEVFFSYAHEDEGLRDKLANHLKLLERQGVIKKWHDRQILPGSEWKGQIDGHLESAHIILLLISSDFLASDYCYDVEMTRALQRHDAKEAIVIPIILRPIDNWNKSPFGKLQALPTDGKAITTWSNQDEAFTNVAQGIRRVAEAFNSGSSAADTTPQPTVTPPPSPPSPSPLMSQTNTGNSTGWQINVSGGTVNIGHPPQL
ncbi:toll/interleukin-1 receptor domain-containing protein [Oscillatoria sp. FACHB-1407]|uniref:toll/interleukin-1 receptor domain-containing protein n=1 Tax=Oscillatoria sp. FACHB-1407 TaxID=2692847 RepID=UPI0016887BBF|nr:toll/interleukin-1 receptor domain-containing protein [Oscillatoria sp. FACHB-1407]MBD2461743.1 toll/interleukin-1 receptor domain-containing protein [Oscillatoria sp. FACHB-1407]